MDDAHDTPTAFPDGLRSALKQGLGDLSGPRLVVFRAQVERNIEHLRSHLDEVAAGSGFRHLRAHVKTHKSSWAARLQMDAGISKYKLTPNELDFMIAAGARNLFVSYPLLGEDARRFANAVAENPDCRFLAQIAAPAHARFLAEAAEGAQVNVDFLIDLDVGMHRTGLDPSRALDLHRTVSDANHARLRFTGLHAYDGHIRGNSREERREQATSGMEAVGAVVDRFREQGVAVPLVVAGGTPGFLPDLELLLASLDDETEVEVSPGTWIYWDSGYDRRMPGLFEYAACVLAHVMDRPTRDLLTLNLGHKRWGIDNGPIEVFSEPGLEFVSASEEHTVLRIDPSRGGDVSIQVGAPVLLVPRHVCSSVNLWETFVVLGPDGSIEDPASPVDGRNR